MKTNFLAENVHTRVPRSAPTPRHGTPLENRNGEEARNDKRVRRLRTSLPQTALDYPSELLVRVIKTLPRQRRIYALAVAVETEPILKYDCRDSCDHVSPVVRRDYLGKFGRK